MIILLILWENRYHNSEELSKMTKGFSEAQTSFQPSDHGTDPCLWFLLPRSQKHLRWSCMGHRASILCTFLLFFTMSLTIKRLEQSAAGLCSTHAKPDCFNQHSYLLQSMEKDKVHTLITLLWVRRNGMSQNDHSSNQSTPCKNLKVRNAVKG